MLTGGGGAALGHLRQRPTLLAEAPPHVTARAHARSLSLYDSFPIAPTAVAAQRCLRQTALGHRAQRADGFRPLLPDDPVASAAVSDLRIASTEQAAVTTTGRSDGDNH